MTQLCHRAIATHTHQPGERNTSYFSLLRIIGFLKALLTHLDLSEEQGEQERSVKCESRVSDKGKWSRVKCEEARENHKKHEDVQKAPEVSAWRREAEDENWLLFQLA